MNSLTPNCPTKGDEVDPRVKDELETLNFASSEINKLETEIDKAREKFRHLLSDSTTRLNSLYKKLGKCVGKARPYFELMKHSKEAEDELTKATVAYQRSNSTYRAAKETVALAEERMTSGIDRPEFDSAWQEMMNHATMRFVESEKEKRVSEDLHQKCAAEFTSVQQKLRSMQKDIPRSINRAKPYFELKDQLEARLQGERRLVEDLQRALTAAKEVYRESLSMLESISEEIHQQRKLDTLPPRTPGVGAEDCTSQQTDMLSINLDAQSTASDIFPDESDVASLCSQDVASLLDSPPEQQPTQVLLGQMSELPDKMSDMARLASSSQWVNKHSRSTSAPVTTTSSHRHSGKMDDIAENSKQPTSNQPTAVVVKGKQLQTEICITPPDTDSCTFLINTPAQHHDPGLPCTSSPTESVEQLTPVNSGTKQPQPPTTTRGRPKDKRVQKLNPSNFPILQGLTETNKRMSPKLPNGRPKGQELPVHHSPSPVRKAGTEYFEFPEEPKLRSKASKAREASPGPNLFPDSDTSLFEKRTYSNHSKENAKTHKQQRSQATNGDSGPVVPTPGTSSRSKTLGTVLGSNDLDLSHSASASLPNVTEQKSPCGDGVTEDGKVFYHL